MKKPKVKMGKVDFVLFFVIMILVAFGVVMVYSASSYSAFFSSDFNYDSYYFLKRQALWAVMGTVVMVMALNIDYHVYRKVLKYVLPATIVLLIAVLIFGKEVNGAKRWLGSGGISIQPSEIAKYVMVMYLAHTLDKKGEGIKKFWSGVVPVLVVCGGVAALILVEPNLSIAAVIGFVTLILVFAAGCKPSHLGMLIGSCGIIGGAAIYFEDFRRARLFSFLDPWKDASGVGYQLSQSLIALGSGGIFGVGLGQSRQKCYYIPECQNDFIFAIIGEELGLVGCLFVIALYVIFISRGIRVAVRAKDTYGSLLAIGITAVVAVQAMINIAVVSGSMPVTGVPLPFISYGGSALIFNMFAMGILLNISRQSERA